MRETIKFVKNIFDKKKFILEDAFDRRSIENVKNLENIDVIEFNNKNNELLNLNVLFLGFTYYITSTCRIFEMERMLLPYYFSFYLGKSVYLVISGYFFEVDYSKKRIIKIEKIPEIDLVISRSAFINENRAILESFIKKPSIIVISPVNDYRQDADYIFRNDFLFKLSDPSEIKLYRDNFGMRYNIILFCGTIYNYKGQLEFLKNIDPNLIKDYLILFLGSIRNQKYYEKVIKVANEKAINILHYFSHPKDLPKIVPRCKYQISYCAVDNDPNPKSINEGIIAGLPFLVSDLVTIPKILWRNPKIGVVCANNNAKDLNKKLRILLTLKNEDVINFVNERCQVEDICKNTTEKVIEIYNKLNNENKKY